jgi:isoaspartyl peptidase/L-asparaginase-like protein (Ntn-hydrolase superfamily)
MIPQLTMPESSTWAVAIHGGAGVISRTLNASEASIRIGHLRDVIEHARDLLAAGVSALDAVEAVVIDLEEVPVFNAGRGAVLTSAGTHELEAAIMDGDTGDCGAVCLVRSIRNPIRLARRVLETSPHVLLADATAEAIGPALERRPNEWFTTPLRQEELARWVSRNQKASQADARGPATVGAVACDVQGRLAAATSTGGRTGKPPGRIGDTPTIGAGTWADDHCAVSGTGDGEAFMALVAGHALAMRMKLQGLSLHEAAEEIVHRGLPPRSGGLIAVDRGGAITMPFNCEGMYRAMADSSGQLEAAIWD